MHEWHQSDVIKGCSMQFYGKIKVNKLEKIYKLIKGDWFQSSMQGRTN